MKRVIWLIVVAGFLLCNYSMAFCFTSGSTGADGAFNPTADTELQLPADGIFNFTTVTIPSGVKVTFKRNAANTPVYMLATGDVIIGGAINVNGEDAVSSTAASGGPGGFAGGYGGAPNKSGSAGLGPGGGATTDAIIGSVHYGSGGGYGTVGGPGGYVNHSTPGGSVYGNEKILPVIGGSGGGGSGGNSGSIADPGGAGGGGGGALVIASSGTITVTGTITSNGGKGVMIRSSVGAGGSGGAIKLMANSIAGNGTITAIGAPGAWGAYSAYGGSGRIRLEAVNITRTTGSTPAYTYGMPGSVFIAKTPALRISRVGGVDVPLNPTGAYSTPDITLPSATTNPVEISLSASEIPLGTTVSVSAIPLSGSPENVTSSPLSGTTDSSTASASLNLSTEYPNVITAEATFTVQTAMFYEGEKIEKVRVAATMGKGLEVTYITEKGKEIPAAEFMAKAMW